MMIFYLFLLFLAWLVLGQKLFAWLAILSVVFALWYLTRWALRRGRWEMLALFVAAAAGGVFGALTL